MEAFWKAAAVIIMTVILGVTLGKTEKDIAVVMSVAACSIVMMVSVQYLSGIVDFLCKLGNSVDYDNASIGILLKISGVALLTELTGMISTDAGNSALGKAMQILGNAVILFLSLPLFEAFLSVVQEIMGFI